VSSGAIVSVVWFTSTSWRRDQVFLPNTLVSASFMYVWEDLFGEPTVTA
jgi:hypothetical protein